MTANRREYAVRLSNSPAFKCARFGGRHLLHGPINGAINALTWLMPPGWAAKEIRTARADAVRKTRPYDPKCLILFILVAANVFINGGQLEAR